MKRNHSGFRPGPNQRQKMDRDVTEKNVQKLRAFPVQNRGDRPYFPHRQLPGLVANLPKPEAPQKMSGRFLDNLDFLERKLFRILPFLRDHDRLHALETGDLPIDVQHLRLEKGCAVKRDYRS